MGQDGTGGNMDGANVDKEEEEIGFNDVIMEEINKVVEKIVEKIGEGENVNNKGVNTDKVINATTETTTAEVTVDEVIVQSNLLK